jgi:hypothetical protein
MCSISFFLSLFSHNDDNKNARCVCSIPFCRRFQKDVEFLDKRLVLKLQWFSFYLLAAKPVEPSCKAIVDIAYILDSSGSLRNEYGLEKAFLKTLSQTLGVTVNKSRAGVVTFSYYSEHSIKLNEHTDQTSFNKHVDRIALMGSTTRIDKALRLTQKEMFTFANGARPGVAKVVILLTDGSQTNDADAEDPAVIANELRLSGINVIVVGIGQGVNATELNHIGGGTYDSDSYNTFIAGSFEELLSYEFSNKVQEAACVAGKPALARVLTACR